MKPFTGRRERWRDKILTRRGASNPIIPDVSNDVEVSDIPEVPRVPESQPATER